MISSGGGNFLQGYFGGINYRNDTADFYDRQRKNTAQTMISDYEAANYPLNSANKSRLVPKMLNAEPLRSSY